MLISDRNGHEAENAQQPVARPTAAQNRSVSRNESQPNHTAVARVAPLHFRKAVKHDAKVRLAITGPSGSGKTYTLLKLATELGGPIAVVDTERGSAEKYADLFAFDTLPLESFSQIWFLGSSKRPLARDTVASSSTRFHTSGVERMGNSTKWRK